MQGWSESYFIVLKYPDKNNFERFAIYPTLALIERLPNHLAGVIGHEQPHIIALKGRHIKIRPLFSFRK